MLTLGIAAAAQAQTSQSAPPPQTTLSATTSNAGAPAPLVLYFGTASSKIRPQDDAVLDQASRAFNEGKPIVMVVVGGADAVGQPEQNLILSQQRAGAVLNALVARGIPVGRFQVLAKGETEPAVLTPQGVAEARNRRVEITWR